MRRTRWTVAVVAAVAGLVTVAAVPGIARDRTAREDWVDDAYVQPKPVVNDVIEWTPKHEAALRTAGKTAAGKTPARVAGANCDTTGKQIEFIYAVPFNKFNQYPTRAATIRSDAAAMQSWLKREAGPRRDQTFRFCTTGGVVAVNEVVLSTTVTSEGRISAQAVENDLAAAGFASTDRKYVVYIETQPEELILCGSDSTSHGCTRSGYEHDPSASVTNANNTGPSYGMLTIYHDGRLKTAMHELFHALGAVQGDSPGYSSTSYAHTRTASELMTGGPTQYHCDPGTNSNGDTLTIDCGKDDYYSTLCAVDKSRCPGPNGTSGPSVYLANAFNIAQYSQFLGPIVPTPADAMTCFAATPTLLEEHSETWSGGSSNDAIWADDGFDVLQGFSGNDSLCGSSGNDEVQGGGSDDSVAGGGGTDTVRGGPGNDTIRGNDNDDYLYDGMGADTIDGGSGTDTLYQCADSVSDNVTGVENVVTASSTYC